jgi:proteic killer suppression protein
MELAFGSRKLRTICEDQVCAEQSLSSSVARQLRGRLADLHAARSLDELVAGRPILDDSDDRSLLVDLGEEVSLRMQINHAEPPLSDDGSIDWARVRRLKIVSIGGSDD